MTVPEFLNATTLSFPEIAKQCGVHLSQVYRWREGTTDPRGFAAFKLFELSQHKIEMKRRRRGKRGRS